MTRFMSGRLVRSKGGAAAVICLTILALSGCEMAGSSGDSILDGLPALAPEDSQDAEIPAVGRVPEPTIGAGVQVDRAGAEAIRDAALAYVRRETAIEDIDVSIDAVAGGWARVRVLPTGSATDPATLYLRQDGSAWRGITIGTAFTPPDLDEMGIPESVRP